MTVPTTIGFAGTGDHVTTTLNGALAAAATTMTIGTGLDIPAANGILHIDYDSTTAVGSDNGPETVKYTAYTTATGAITGLTRGADAKTTDVAHANGATVMAGLSALHLNNLTDIIENSAWTTWVPTWTNLTIGNGTNTAAYTRIGKLVFFRLITVFGSTTSMGSAPNFSLPVTAIASVPTHGSLLCSLADTGTASYFGELLYSTTNCELVTVNAAGTYLSESQTTSTVPFTWTTSDVIEVAGFYEAA